MSLKAWIGEAAVRSGVGGGGGGGPSGWGVWEQVVLELMRRRRILHGVATNLNQVAARLNARLGDLSGRLTVAEWQEVREALQQISGLLERVERTRAQVDEEVAAIEMERRRWR